MLMKLQKQVPEFMFTHSAKCIHSYQTSSVGFLAYIKVTQRIIHHPSCYIQFVHFAYHIAVATARYLVELHVVMAEVEIHQ